MIQMETMLNVADNSGAKRVKCIKVLGALPLRRPADVVMCAVQGGDAGGSEEGRCRPLCHRPHRQGDPSQGRQLHPLRPERVLVNKDGEPKGTCIFGPVARELRDQSA